MTFYVKIENDIVTQCWDTPPPSNETGWVEAIEVKPSIIQYRQCYDTHYFDTTKTPVEITWVVKEITVAERKSSMLSDAKSTYTQTVQTESLKAIDSSTYDTTILDAAKATYTATVTAINAATTHDELDLVI